MTELLALLLLFLHSGKAPPWGAVKEVTPFCDVGHTHSARNSSSVIRTSLEIKHISLVSEQLYSPTDSD